MNIRNLINRYTLPTVLLCASTMPMHTAHAAAGPIAIEDSPLFLLNSAKPNIFFVFDDSRSMDEELSTNSSEAQNFLGYVFSLTSSSGSKNNYQYVYDEAMSDNVDNSDNDVVPHPDLVAAQGWTGGNITTKPWRAYSYAYNKIFYNPDVTYKPWPGYPNARADRAATYPTTDDPPTANYISLIDYRSLNGRQPGGSVAGMDNFYPAQYYYWNDDGDGVVEDGEGIKVIISDGGSSISASPTSAGQFVVGTQYEIAAPGTTDFTLIGASDNNVGTTFTATGAGSGTGTAFPVTRPAASSQCTGTDTPATTTPPCTKRTYSEEIQNFANWFVYYRKRLLTAKAAVGLTIDDEFAENTRMGIATINTTNAASDSVMREVLAPMYDDTLTPADTNKTTLLNKLFSTNINATTTSTPLKAALDRAGKYFECSSGSFFGTNVCAIEGMTDASTYVANSAGECQQNYTIMITDGEYSTDNSNYVGNADADTSSPTDGYQFDGAPYADNEPSSGNDSTLADIAMYYYKRDLQPSLIDNNVPISCGVDENPAQHMVTYTVTFGISGNLTWDNMPNRPIATAGCGTVGTATAPSWPTGYASFSNAEKVDDVLHAAYNGRGKYLSAGSSQELVDSLKTSLLDIAGRKGVSSAIGLSSTNNTGNTQAYLATFNSGGWFGELNAYAINTNGTLASTVTWSAHTKLNNLSYNAIIDTPQVTASNVSAINTAHNTRTGTAGTHVADVATNTRAIVTSDPSTTVDATYGFGRPFRWANITGALKDDLKTNETGGTDADDIGKERLNYIRGDHRCEAGADIYLDDGCAANSGFRPRRTSAGTNTRLGDLVNSTPVYVGESIGSYPSIAPFPTTANKTYKDYKDGTDTSAFVTTGKKTTNRTPMLYVGGNDGMLHAFNATTTVSGGTEEFAFIPRVFADSTASGGLHKLTEQNAHRSYVDQTPTIADAFIATPRDSSRKWRTVLVGGLRNGGKGIYALDITDPDAVISASGTAKETAASKKVMWEFTSADDADLGNTFSQPVIVPLRVRSGSDPITASSTTHAIEWFVVFGNGYNSANGKAVLFLLPLSGPGADNTWSNGEYYKIDTGAGNTTDTRGNNGLSSPAVIDYNGDGIFDRAYAGDLWGNMWAFDLTGNDPSTDWDVAFKTGATKYPLAIAKDGADVTQPILVKPVITRNAKVITSASNQPNAMVLFGTGRYLVDGDQSDTSDQTFYGIYDDDNAKNVSRTSTADVLVAKTLLSTTETELRTINPAGTSVDYGTPALKHQGWYFDLPDNGERVTEKATLVGSTLFFSSIVPSTASPCSGGGYSWLNALNPYTGEAPGIQVFNTTSGDSVINSSDIPGDFSAVNTTTAGIRNTEMVPVYSYLSDRGTSPSPCQSGGSSVQGIGSSTNANVTNEQLCAEGGSSKAGRYSWRQLSFD